MEKSIVESKIQHEWISNALKYKIKVNHAYLKERKGTIFEDCLSNDLDGRQSIEKLYLYNHELIQNEFIFNYLLCQFLNFINEKVIIDFFYIESNNLNIFKRSTPLVQKEIILNHVETRSDIPLVDWMMKKVSNFDYITSINKQCFKKPNSHENPALYPWISDFNQADKLNRDLKCSKFVLNKGIDYCQQIYATLTQDDLTKQKLISSLLSHKLPSRVDLHSVKIPSHIQDIPFSICYFIYKARVSSKEELIEYVRPKYEPLEFPNSIENIYKITPDESILDFFTNPSVFQSIHDDMGNLKLPEWLPDDPNAFLDYHHKLFEGEEVSQDLHNWIDMEFGYKLSGLEAVENFNVHSDLVNWSLDSYRDSGKCALFQTPHPKRYLSPKDSSYFDILPPPVETTDKSDLPKNYNPFALIDHFQSIINFTQHLHGTDWTLGHLDLDFEMQEKITFRQFLKDCENVELYNTEKICCYIIELCSHHYSQKTNCWKLFNHNMDLTARLSRARSWLREFGGHLEPNLREACCDILKPNTRFKDDPVQTYFPYEEFKETINFSERFFPTFRQLLEAKRFNYNPTMIDLTMTVKRLRGIHLLNDELLQSPIYRLIFGSANFEADEDQFNTIPLPHEGLEFFLSEFKRALSDHSAEIIQQKCFEAIFNGNFLKLIVSIVGLNGIRLGYIPILERFLSWHSVANDRLISTSYIKRFYDVNSLRKNISATKCLEDVFITFYLDNSIKFLDKIDQEMDTNILQSLIWLSIKLGPQATVESILRRMHCNLCGLMQTFLLAGDTFPYRPASLHMSLGDFNELLEENFQSHLKLFKKTVQIYGSNFSRIVLFNSLVLSKFDDFDAVDCTKELPKRTSELVVALIFLTTFTENFMSDSTFPLLQKDIHRVITQILTFTQTNLQPDQSSFKYIVVILISLIQSIGLKVGFELSRIELSDIIASIFGLLSKSTNSHELQVLAFLTFSKLIGQIYVESMIDHFDELKQVTDTFISIMSKIQVHEPKKRVNEALSQSLLSTQRLDNERDSLSDNWINYLATKACDLLTSNACYRNTLICSYRHQGAISNTCLSPYQDKFLTIGGGKSISLFSLFPKHLEQDDQSMLNLAPVRVFNHHKNTPQDILFQKQNSVLSFDSKFVYLWDIETDQKLYELGDTLKTKFTSITSHAINPNAFLIGTETGQLYMIDSRQPSFIQNMKPFNFGADLTSQTIHANIRSIMDTKPHLLPNYDLRRKNYLEINSHGLQMFNDKNLSTNNIEALRCLEFSSFNGHTVSGGFSSGHVNQVDIRNGNVVSSFQPYTKPIRTIKTLPSGWSMIVPTNDQMNGSLLKLATTIGPSVHVISLNPGQSQDVNSQSKPVEVFADFVDQGVLKIFTLLNGVTATKSQSQSTLGPDPGDKSYTSSYNKSLLGHFTFDNEIDGVSRCSTDLFAWHNQCTKPKFDKDGYIAPRGAPRLSNASITSFRAFSFGQMYMVTYSNGTVHIIC